ncbi:hypothetical protein B0H21DRAFT_757644 [Amylocystis lapponica]|nr:hypothetical protein B0H21DRAFT_757644 [Amylocystis lapponica]
MTRQCKPKYTEFHRQCGFELKNHRRRQINSISSFYVGFLIRASHMRSGTGSRIAYYRDVADKPRGRATWRIRQPATLSTSWPLRLFQTPHQPQHGHNNIPLFIDFVHRCNMRTYAIASKTMIAPQPVRVMGDIQPIPIIHASILPGESAVRTCATNSTVRPQKQTRFLVPSVPNDSITAANSEGAGHPKKCRRRRKSRQDKTPPWQHMVLGYVVPKDVAAKRYAALWGTKDTTDELAYSYRLWVLRHSRLFTGGNDTRVVYVDEEKNEVGWCFSLAENTSAEAMKLPPQSKVDKLKWLLQTKEPPKWWQLYG